MTDPRTDSIAREAARLLRLGRVRSMGEAIRTAAEALGQRDAEMPGHGLVRRHAGAMAMQAMGEAGYARHVRGILAVAERIMTVLAETRPDVETLLVGRPAKGYVDGDVTLHIRLYTRADVGDLARTLEDFGYQEPAFETVNTRHGRLNRLRVEDEGVEAVLTRCLPEMASRSREDLFTGRPIATATLAQLRAVVRKGTKGQRD